MADTEAVEDMEPGNSQGNTHRVVCELQVGQRS